MKILKMAFTTQEQQNLKKWSKFKTKVQTKFTPLGPLASLACIINLSIFFYKHAKLHPSMPYGKMVSKKAKWSYLYIKLQIEQICFPFYASSYKKYEKNWHSCPY